MKFKINPDLCIGCSACEMACPEVFEMPDTKAQVILDPVPNALQAKALDAEGICPVGAISHLEKQE